MPTPARSWALNLRDSGVDVRVCMRADATRDRADEDGFAAGGLPDASTAGVVCVLVPDDAIPWPVATRWPSSGSRPGATSAWWRRGCSGPRCAAATRRASVHNRLRRVHRDAAAIGGLRQGAIEMTAVREAVLDLAVEQALSPALRQVTQSFLQVMLELGIPLEAVLPELLLSGEIERTYRLLGLDGYAAQMEHHSPTSQYGQLSRPDRYDHVDIATTMRGIVDGIRSGAFAAEWDAEREAGHPTLERLKAAAAGPEVRAFEADLRARLGERAGG